MARKKDTENVSFVSQRVGIKTDKNRKEWAFKDKKATNTYLSNKIEENLEGQELKDNKLCNTYQTQQNWFKVNEDTSYEHLSLDSSNNSNTGNDYTANKTTERRDILKNQDYHQLL